MKEINLRGIDFERIEKIAHERAKTKQPTKEFGRISQALYELDQVVDENTIEEIHVEYGYTGGSIIIKSYYFDAGVTEIFSLSKVFNLADTFSIELMDDDTMRITFGFNNIFQIPSDVQKEMQVEYIDNGERKVETTKATHKTQAIRQVQRKNCSSIYQSDFSVK